MPVTVTEYLDEIYKVTETSNIVYNTNPSGSGLKDDGRLLDFYDPTALLYTSSIGASGAAPVVTNRPLLIFVHGGGFEAGSKDNGEADYVCRYFASRGWRAASINYRMLTRPNGTWPLPIRMAVEDTRAALRWAITNAVGYAIDTAKIVVAGSSAGGGAAIFSAMGDVAWEFDNGNYGAFGNPTRPAGVFSLWGVFQPIFNVNASTHNANAALGRCDMTFAAHGTADTAVSYQDMMALGYTIRSQSVSNDYDEVTLHEAPHEPWDDYITARQSINWTGGYYEDAKTFAMPQAVAYFKTQLGL